MSVRISLLILLVVSLSVIAWLNPVTPPTPPSNPRWIKIDAQGNSLPTWSGPWQCVRDTQTGLLWEVKSYAEDLHDKQCSFSWFSGQVGVADKGSCFTANGASGGFDTLDFITYANQTQRCGTTDWRLPTAEELATLLIAHPKPGAPQIAQDYFPYTYAGTYWTANAGQPLSGHYRHWLAGAEVIDFATGVRQVLPYHNAAFVRLVK